MCNVNNSLHKFTEKMRNHQHRHYSRRIKIQARHYSPRNLWVCEGKLHGIYVVVEDGAFHSAVGGYELLVDVSENHLHLCH